MTHVVKINILIGYEKNGNLHFDLKIIFHCIFIETGTVNYEIITYRLTKIC